MDMLDTMLDSGAGYRSAVRKEGDLVMARFPFFLLCVLVRKRCITGRVLDFGWYFGKKF